MKWNSPWILRYEETLWHVDGSYKLIEAVAWGQASHGTVGAFSAHDLTVGIFRALIYIKVESLLSQYINAQHVSRYMYRDIERNLSQHINYINAQHDSRYTKRAYRMLLDTTYQCPACFVLPYTGREYRNVSTITFRAQNCTCTVNVKCRCSHNNIRTPHFPGYEKCISPKLKVWTLSKHMIAIHNSRYKSCTSISNQFILNLC